MPSILARHVHALYTMMTRWTAYDTRIQQFQFRRVEAIVVGMSPSWTFRHGNKAVVQMPWVVTSPAPGRIYGLHGTPKYSGHCSLHPCIQQTAYFIRIPDGPVHPLILFELKSHSNPFLATNIACYTLPIQIFFNHSGNYVRNNDKDWAIQSHVHEAIKALHFLLSDIHNSHCCLTLRLKESSKE